MLNEVLTAAVTRASRAVDEGVLRRIEARMRRTPPLRGERAISRERLLELAHAYRAGAAGEAGDRRFFPAPPRPTVRERSAGDGPEGSRVTELVFESEYRPFLADYADEHLRWRENL